MPAIDKNEVYALVQLREWLEMDESTLRQRLPVLNVGHYGLVRGSDVVEFLRQAA